MSEIGGAAVVFETDCPPTVTVSPADCHFLRSSSSDVEDALHADVAQCGHIDGDAGLNGEGDSGGDD